MSLKKINFKNILAGIVATVMAGTSIVGVAKGYSVESPIYWKYDVTPAEMSVYHNRDKVTVDVSLMLMGMDGFKTVSEIITGQKPTNGLPIARDTVNEYGMMNNGFDNLCAYPGGEVSEAAADNGEIGTDNITTAEQLYSAHIESNPLFFNSGMILADLDEDGIPELFSLEATKDEGISTLSLHPFKNGQVALPSLDAPFDNIDINLFAEESEDNTFFAGLYRNKNTDNKALIICDLKSDNKVFDVIEYDGKNLKFDQIYEITNDVNAFGAAESEKFMADYESCNDELFVSVSTDETKDKTTKAVFEELMAEFKK